MTLVLKHLEEDGYHCIAHKLRASDFGLPQRRTRYYILGVRKDAEIFAEPMEKIHQSISLHLQCLRILTSQGLPIALYLVLLQLALCEAMVVDRLYVWLSMT